MLDPQFPRTLPEFQEAFGDEARCLDYIRRQKWPDGFRCPRCSHDRAYPIHVRKLEQCVACGHQASITAGTMFHGTRKPLTTWFRVIFEFVSRKHGCNARDIERLFGLSRKVAWTWLHKIRDVMVTPGRSPLSGVVQVDEAYVGGPEEGVHGRDRGAKKHLVVGAVEQRGEFCGRARLAPVDSASQADLQTWVSDVVVEGSTVRTDGWPSYKGLDGAYDHAVHVIGRDPREASRSFPHVHRIFSLFKRVVISTYQGSVSRKYLPAYCNEYVFRFNRRTSSSRTHLVQRVLENAIGRPARVHSFVQLHRIDGLMAS